MTSRGAKCARYSSSVQLDILSGVRVARIATVPFFVLSQLKHQIKTIAASGAEVMVVTSDGSELAALEEISGVVSKPIEISRSISPANDLRALAQLFQLFRQSRVDIAHSTTPKAGLLTAIAAFLAGVPIRLHTFTGQPWVNLKGPVRWFARWSDWLIGKLNTRCYADSESQRQFLIDQGIVSARDMFVVGAGSLAGVDLNRFNPAGFSSQDRMATCQKLGIPEDVPVLLFVGRLAVDKGIRELISAFLEIKKAGSSAHLVLAGPFDAERGGKEEFSRHEIDGIRDIHLVGYTECPEMYLAIADILCLPSYREGFGTVVIEAAAMGVPTVGTDIYGLSDAVVNGETGILVPPYDSVALGEALETLLGNDELRLRMGRTARSRAQKFFDADQVNRKVVEEYCALLNEGKR